MKGLIFYKRDGETFTKFDAFDLYNALKYLRDMDPSFSLSSHTASDVLEPHLPDIWIITGAADAFGGNTNGCLNLSAGDWDYIRMEKFETIETRYL